MYQVLDISSNQTLWIEPVTGILFKDPHWTHYSMIATWLPLANGSGFDPLTGRILLTQASNIPLSLINQVEESYPKTLYEQGSLSGILEDNNFYNAPASPGSQRVEMQWWSPFVTHIITGGVSLILTILLIPAIFKLCSACIMKGEDVLERTILLPGVRSNKGRSHRSVV